jgi:hypothetical protein
MAHTERVKALLEKGADMNAENEDKCAFSCGLYGMGDGCMRRLGLCGVSTRGVRVGAMQVDGTARRIFHGPHGDRKGAAREGRGCERQERPQVRVFLVAVFDGRRLPLPARLCGFRLVVERVGSIQVDGTARRIFHGPHGDREGAAREGRGRLRREQ